MKVVLEFVVSIFILVVMSSTVVATDRYVSLSGGNVPPYTSWATAARSIQPAVDVSVAGDTVIVTNGVYYPTSQVSVTKGITIRSANGAAVTAIDGQEARRCLYVSAPNAIVDGFTIRNGYSEDDGAGVLVVSNGYVKNSVIRNNVIHYQDGGGVALQGGGTVYNCLIVSNRNDWGGSYGWGGGVCIMGAGTVESCTITKNSNPRGSGIRTDGGGLVVNSVVQGNIGSDNLIFYAGGSAVYSCMSPLVAGTGNITSDPLFVNAAAGDYRLTSGSPCVNTGSNQSWMPAATDLGGNPRIVNGTVDMGAYEYFLATTITVAFDAQGGTTPNPLSKSVTFASTYGTLATTSRTGYTFGGWWTGVGGTGSQVTSSTTMTTATNHTLYAKWTAHTYMVTYNGNGSTGGSTANSSHTYDVAKALTSNGFTRTGYTFAGWATSAGGAVAYSNGQSVLNLSATQGATVTFYAKWTANTYTVTYNGNGSTGGFTANSSHTYAVAKALTSNGFTRTGYAFAGWATSAGGAVAYSNGQSVLNLSATQGATVTLYAKWTAVTYTVTYNGNGSTGGSTANSSHTYDVAKALTSNGFSRTGYTFAGWATSAGGALAHSNGESVLNLSATQGATVTLYAKWTLLTYAVTYDANGATSGTAPASQTKTHDVALTLATNSGSLLKTGYTFAGWNTAANGSGTNYAEGVSYAADEAIVLYAKWSASLSAVYRFWSPKFRGHFFTISESEKNNIIANLSSDWSYEGIAYYAFTEQAAGTVPLYRFWSNRYNGHFFTISESEKNNIVANLSRDWSYEGIAYYVYPDAGAGGTPVYRFWSNRYKHHFFTISEAEKNNIVANLSRDWSYEGIAYYVPSARAASPSGALPAVASTVFAGDADVAAASAEKVVAKAAALPAAATIGAASGTGDVLFPLSVPGGKVTAKISDMESGEDAEVLADADAPVAVSGVEAGRRYRLEVSVEDTDGAASRIVHASSFEHRADEPDGLGDVDAARAVAGTGVGNPVERIVAPEADGPITFKLWSATQGVVETREGVAAGETVEFAIPDWNCWHWVGGWRESDDELVLSLWLRHELE